MKTEKKGQKLSLDDFDEDMKKEIIRQMNKREKRRRLLILLCAFIGVSSLGYFGVYSYMAEKNQNQLNSLASLKEKTDQYKDAQITVHKTGDIELPDILEEYKVLYNKNKSLIGWLKIDDTIIDYPVMQSKDPDYYLDHNYDQEYDKNGSIFLDTQCSMYPRNTNLIVYGHNMKSGKMFGSLSKYSKKSYYEEHPKIQFDTIYEKGTYEIVYVFRSRVYTEEEIVFKYYQFINPISKEEFQSGMEEMQKLSLYETGVTPSYGDELLTLSTCDYNENEGRFVVVAKRID